MRYVVSIIFLLAACDPDGSPMRQQPVESDTSGTSDTQVASDTNTQTTSEPDVGAPVDPSLVQPIATYEGVTAIDTFGPLDTFAYVQRVTPGYQDFVRRRFGADDVLGTNHLEPGSATVRHIGLGSAFAALGGDLEIASLRLEPGAEVTPVTSGSALAFDFDDEHGAVAVWDSGALQIDELAINAQGNIGRNINYIDELDSDTIDVMRANDGYVASGGGHSVMVSWGEQSDWSALSFELDDDVHEVAVGGGAKGPAVLYAYGDRVEMLDLDPDASSAPVMVVYPDETMTQLGTCLDVMGDRIAVGYRLASDPQRAAVLVYETTTGIWADARPTQRYVASRSSTGVDDCRLGKSGLLLLSGERLDVFAL